ncbi:hypothetical protein EPYR_02384 [Erwinia pyrifoliae DSM 12163]|nr:hypothetical protein EPYR_02384 [Erwinia pyrifoliae DSM 12163]
MLTGNNEMGQQGEGREKRYQTGKVVVIWTG